MVDGVMYVTSANEAMRSMRAAAARSGTTAARARPGLAGDAAGGINRGVAVLGDRVFMVTDNAHLLALHRVTGQLLWDVEMADSRQNYGATGAPLVVNDLVISGVSGGDEGIRGFLDAFKLHRRACLALLDRPGARRARVGNLGRPRDRTRLRRHLAHRHLRSGARSCFTGPPAIPAPTTTATSVRATISIPIPCWRSIRIPAN